MKNDYADEILEVIDEYNQGLVSRGDLQGVIEAKVKRIQHDTTQNIYKLWKLENWWTIEMLNRGTHIDTIKKMLSKHEE